MDGTIEKTEFLLVEIRAPAVRDVVEVIPRELTTVSDKSETMAIWGSRLKWLHEQGEQRMYSGSRRIGSTRCQRNCGAGG
jgi:hypothetical protein